MTCKCGHEEEMTHMGINGFGSLYWCLGCGTLCVKAHPRGLPNNGDLHWERPKNWVETNDENEIIRLVTRAVRRADADFEKGGGSSRHWVRDWFLAYLRQEGLVLMKAGDEKDGKLEKTSTNLGLISGFFCNHTPLEGGVNEDS